MSSTEVFANFPATTVPAGADSGSGTETWIVSSSDGFPTAQTGVTQFHVADTAPGAASELILVTNMSGTNNNTWTVTRGAEGTDPVVHAPGFTVTAVITAGWLNGVSGSALPDGTPGAVLYANSVPAPAWLGGNTTGTKEFLTSTGSGGLATTPQWGTITASDVPVLNQNTTGTAGNVTGVVAVSNGGTGGTAVSAYAVLTGGTSATAPLQQVSGAGGSGQVLTSQGAGVLPAWAASPAGFSNPMTTHGDMIYENASLVAAALTGNTTATKNFLTSTGSGGTANSPVWGTIAALDVPVLNQNTTGTASNVTGIVAVANGGTGGTAATAYAVITGGTSSTATLQQVAGVGSSGQVLTSNGAGQLPSWQPATGGTVAFPVTVPEGGTGGTAATAYAVVTGGTSATAPFQAVSGVGSSGQVLTSAGASALPGWQGIPAAGASAGGTITLAGDLGNTASSPQVVSTHLTSPLPVTQGGTGGTTATAYAVVTGGTAATSALQQVSGVGTSGQVLVSAGAGALPAWHHASGMFLATPNSYAPGTQTSLTVTSGTMAAFASGTVCTGPFTAPVSGSVLVSASLIATVNVGNTFTAFGLAASGSVSPVIGNVIVTELNSSTAIPAQVLQWPVTGLTAGNTYNFDLLGASSGTATILAFAQSTTTPVLTNSGRGAPVVMTVQAI